MPASRFHGFRLLWLSSLLAVLVSLGFTPRPARAQEEDPPLPNAYDLIASVNALRNLHGLGSLNMDGSLMAAAQQQADDLAAGLAFGHTGVGGTSADDRARMNGYPFYEGIDVMECWASVPPGTGTGDVVFGFWSDEVHTNVMIHAYARDVGAGIAADENGAIFLVLDVGADYWGTGTRGRATATTLPGWMVTPGGPTLTPEVFFPVFTATPQPDGSLKHHVEPGQALWTIAIAYEMKIDEIARLNGLDLQNPIIYAGQDLLLRQPGAAPPAAPAPLASAPTVDGSPPAAVTRAANLSAPTRTATVSPEQTLTATPAPSRALPPSNRRITGLLLLVFCAGGLLALGWSWFKPRASA